MKKYLALILAIMFMVTLAPFALASDEEAAEAVAASLIVSALTPNPQLEPWTEVDAKAKVLALAEDLAGIDYDTTFVADDGEAFEAGDPEGTAGSLTVKLKVELKSNTAISAETPLLTIPLRYGSGSGDDVMVPATTDSATLSSIQFNLTTGTVDGTIDIKAYALLGHGKGEPAKGVKWVAYDATKYEKTVEKLLKSGGTLYLSNAVPAETGTATSLKFAEIEKQTKPKLAVNYFPLAATNSWVVFKKDDMKTEWDKPKAVEDLEYITDNSATPSLAKLPDMLAQAGNKWDAFPDDVGLPVSDWKKGEKDAKATYFVREPAAFKDGKYYPPSAAIKLGIAPLGKAPGLKANFKTEIVKIKAGQIFATASSVVAATESSLTYASYTSLEIRANKELANISIAYVISADNEGSFHVFVGATAKKPASKTQTVALAKRFADPTGDILTMANNKKIEMDAKYEARIAPTATSTSIPKWGKAPKVSLVSTGTSIQVRQKATAKWNKTNTTNNGFGDTYAASAIVEYKAVAIDADGKITFELVIADPDEKDLNDAAKAIGDKVVFEIKESAFGDLEFPADWELVRDTVEALIKETYPDIKVTAMAEAEDKIELTLTLNGKSKKVIVSFEFEPED